MNDHLIGNLTTDETQIDGQLVNKDQSISGSITESSRSIEGNLTNAGSQKIEGSLSAKDKNVSGALSPKSKNMSASVQNIQAGTKNYNFLLNKPMIEGVELIGDKSFEDLNLHPLSNADLAKILV